MASKSFLLALFLFSIHHGSVAGLQGVRSSRRLDEVKGPKKRECKLEQEADKDTGIADEVEFKCKAKTENEADDTEIKDEIDFTIKKEGAGIKVKVEYEQEIETEESETESETQYEILFDRIIEYRKGSTTATARSASSASTTMNGEAAFDWGNDSIIQEMSLAQLGGFSDIVSDATGDTSTFTISTTDDVATFTFTIRQGGENEDITANKMKIDFELKNFPWLESDSYVALISTIESERKVEIDYEDGSDQEVLEDVRISFEDAVSSTKFVPFGEYTWANEALVTSADTNVTLDTAVAIKVVATSPKDGITETIAFSFIGDAARSAQDIYWDPEAGVGYNSGSGSGSVHTMVSAVVAGSIYALVVLL